MKGKLQKLSDSRWRYVSGKATIYIRRRDPAAEGEMPAWEVDHGDDEDRDLLYYQNVDELIEDYDSGIRWGQGTASSPVISKSLKNAVPQILQQTAPLPSTKSTGSAGTYIPNWPQSSPLPGAPPSSGYYNGAPSGYYGNKPSKGCNCNCLLRAYSPNGDIVCAGCGGMIQAYGAPPTQTAAPISNKATLFPISDKVSYEWLAQDYVGIVNVMKNPDQMKLDQALLDLWIGGKSGLKTASDS